jgi:site-specific DNA recombinase
VAEDERTLSAERRRRGRHAKRRSGQLLPWTRAPYGSLLDPARPRAPSRVRLAPVQAAVVEPMCAWYTDASQGSCTSSLRVIPIARQSGTMPLSPPV